MGEAGGGEPVKRPVDHAGGEMEGNRSRTGFAAAKERAVSKRSNAARSVPHRIDLENGDSMPGTTLDPKPPPVMVLYRDLRR